MNDSGQQPPSPAPNRAVIIAFLVGGFLLVTVSMLAQKFRTGAGGKTPGIQVVDGDSISVTNPASIRFVTNANLAAGPNGWAAGKLHPHALVDSVVLMPAGNEITRLPGDTFSLTLPRLDPGTHQVRIFWADASHQPTGKSAQVTVHIRE